MKSLTIVAAVLFLVVVSLLLAIGIRPTSGQESTDKSAQESDNNPVADEKAKVELVLNAYIKAAQNDSSDIVKYVVSGNPFRGREEKSDVQNSGVEPKGTKTESKAPSVDNQPKEYNLPDRAIEAVGHGLLSVENPKYIREMNLQPKRMETSLLRPTVYSVRVFFESLGTNREVVQDYIVRLEGDEGWKVVSVALALD
jgi:hypothetical protein